MKTILVVGGAGYIGSHMVKTLSAAGHRAVVLDDLSTGHRDAVTSGELIEGSLGDRRLLDHLFSTRSVDGVMHFASLIQVGESVVKPAEYYANNVCNTVTLLEAMIAHGVAHFVFSSSAAVYGEPERVPIEECHPKNPVNPYGRSKWMVEQILEDFGRAYGLKSMRLRYFNAAGADPDGTLGERHDPETHLIPLALGTAAGRQEAIDVFGADYDTADGTCVRDYLHVADLCAAHLSALDRLWSGAPGGAYNLGTGRGYSVREVIAAVEKVTGCRVSVHSCGRRPGDPAVLVADPRRAQKELGWTPRLSDLDTIIAHAWQWELKSHAPSGHRPAPV